MSMVKSICGKLQRVCMKVSNRLYENRVRKQLKNPKFSIICSNCIGGVIYHRLGKEFLSPTINLWMTQSDFLKFVSDLKGYLDRELIFVQDEAAYPVAMLGDIKIHFNHYASEKQARDCWNRRKARVCFDNLYLIMYDRGVTRDDLLKFGEIPCKNRLVLSHRKYSDIPYVKTIKPNDKANGDHFLDVDWRGRRTFEKKLDYVNWLNS